MAVRTYSVGTASVETGGTVVTITGGTLSATNARETDRISIDGEVDVLITDVIDLNHLAIPRRLGQSKTNVPYVIYQNYPARVVGAAAAEEVSELVADLRAEGLFKYVKPGPDGPTELGITADEGQYARQPATGKEWLMEGGVWVFQGVTGNFSATGDPWSPEAVYTRNVIVPHGGKLWFSLQPNNLNHVPESSPTWWKIFLEGGDAFDIAQFDTNRPESGEILLDFIVTRKITFSAGMALCRAHARIGATANAVYSFKKNGVQFATMTFAAGGQAGPQLATFYCPTQTTFDPANNDLLSIIAPPARDETLSAIAWTIAASRV